MAFTDDDLKRVKREIPKGMAEYAFDSMALTVEDLQALVARLEAAEKIVRRFQDVEQGSHLYKAWRKSKGGER